MLDPLTDEERTFHEGSWRHELQQHPLIELKVHQATVNMLAWTFNLLHWLGAEKSLRENGADAMGIRTVEHKIKLLADLPKFAESYGVELSRSFSTEDSIDSMMAEVARIKSTNPAFCDYKNTLFEGGVCPTTLGITYTHPELAIRACQRVLQQHIDNSDTSSSLEALTSQLFETIQHERENLPQSQPIPLRTSNVGLNADDVADDPVLSNLHELANGSDDNDSNSLESKN